MKIFWRENDRRARVSFSRQKNPIRSLLGSLRCGGVFSGVFVVVVFLDFCNIHGKGHLNNASATKCCGPACLWISRTWATASVQWLLPADRGGQVEYWHWKQPADPRCGCLFITGDDTCILGHSPPTPTHARPCIYTSNSCTHSGWLSRTAVPVYIL